MKFSRIHHSYAVRCAAASLGLVACIATAGCDDRPSAAGAPELERESVESPESGAHITRASGTPESPAAISPLEAQYAALLARVVTDEGAVRYELLAVEPSRSELDAVVAGYAAAMIPDQITQRKALWCNAYNANILKIVTEESARAGFTTINQVPGVFTSHGITVAGEALTLDGLKDRLRTLNDPRIHAALVFGARACPPLRPEPYVPDRLDEQLDDQCLRWLDDPSRHLANRRGLLVSQIFEWYAGDFDAAPYHGVLGFIRKHAHSGGSLRNYIRGVGGSPQVRYLPFTWALNSPIVFDPALTRDDATEDVNGP